MPTPSLLLPIFVVILATNVFAHVAGGAKHAHRALGSDKSNTPDLHMNHSLNVYVHVPLECAAGCTKFGNCNQEYGTCECPWPRIGAECEVDRLTLCYDAPATSPNATMPSCGILVPKNCECYKQCVLLHCPDPRSRAGDVNICDHELGMKIGEAHCFSFRDRPVEEQVSIVPRNDTGDVDWYQMPGQGPSGWPYGKPEESFRLDKKKEWMLSRSQDEKVIPMDGCLLGCSDRGACIEATRPNEERRVRCICRKGFKGDGCEEEDPEGACWFDPTCGGHGKCRSGFCHCDQGWWGMGCGRSKAYALAPGSKALPSRTKLRIYMYDFPSDIVFPGEYNDGAYTRDDMYAAYEYFLRYFLQDWTVRTENPQEANMFFIPALLYFYIGNVRNPLPHMRKVVKFISNDFPFWNRTGGKDHFWWMTGDQGACFLPDDLMSKPIKLVHFGLSGSNVSWRNPPHNTKLNTDYACLLPERDIVTPPVVHNAFPKEGHSMELFKTVIKANGDDKRTRKMLFFFAGGVQMKDLKYSGGARQALYTTLHSQNFSDVLVVEGTTPRYDELFLESKFCVTPYGFGWGLRLPIAVTHGCIPVVIQDHVWQPFEDIIPYEDFSVRLRVKDIPNIVPLLRAYDQDQLQRLRLALAKHWAAFLWPREAGGQAYEYTLKALKKKMHNLAAEYFRRAE